MNRDQELALGDALLARVQQGSVPAAAPAVGLSSDVYRSSQRHQGELLAIDAHPVAAVAASELAKPGDFVTLTLGGVPLVVVRAADGVVRALHNVCAHRGGTVEAREQGTARMLSCGFHGWSYELDGSLRSVSDAAQFSSVPCGRDLGAVPCEERHGLIWVRVRPVGGAHHPAMAAGSAGVRTWLGERLDDVFSALRLDAMVCHAATDFHLDCNWKLLTDGFLELYHLKYLHRNTIAPYFPANLTLTERYGDRGRHLATVIPKNRLLRQLATTARQDWRILDDLTMPFVLMPATVVQWQAGHAEVFSLRPDRHDPGRTHCRLMMLVPAARAAERELWDRNWERVCATIPGEDFAVAEDVQRNIGAGLLDELLIGDNERYLCAHLAAVDALVAETASAPA